MPPKRKPAHHRNNISVGPPDLVLEVIEKVRKEFGLESAILASEGPKAEVSGIISTGLDVIDHHVIGVGGLPMGRASEVFGPESSGKTTFGLHCIGEVQKQGGVGIWLEAETSFDAARARTLGVDTDRLIILQPECLDVAGDQMSLAVRSIPTSVKKILAVWDSVAGLATRKEIEEGIDESGFDSRAKTMSRTCRTFGEVLKNAPAHIMFINQIREKIGVLFGSNITTPGGHGIKHLASLRFALSFKAAVKDKDGHIGSDVQFRAIKNKFAPPWRDALVRLDYTKGWDNEWSTLAVAQERDLLPARSRGAKAYRTACEKLGWPVKDFDEAEV